MFVSYYKSILGRITLISDGEYLTNLYIEGQDTGILFSNLVLNDKLPIFISVKKWLDEYFIGILPKEKINIKFIGTPFRMKVWNELTKIPYGSVCTYNDIANRLGLKKGSARAVGGAIHNNPISILVPCHRVIGSNNSLVGYNGGVDLKKKLLEIEKVSL